MCTFIHRNVGIGNFWTWKDNICSQICTHFFVNIFPHFKFSHSNCISKRLVSKQFYITNVIFINYISFSRMCVESSDIICYYGSCGKELGHTLFLLSKKMWYEISQQRWIFLVQNRKYPLTLILMGFLTNDYWGGGSYEKFRPPLNFFAHFTGPLVPPSIRVKKNWHSCLQSHLQTSPPSIP